MKRPAVGVGLIGLGRHGLRYARHLLEDIPDARLIAVCRRDPSQGFPLPAPYPIEMMGQVADLIHHPAVEVVVSVTPPHLSPLICSTAVEAGKPLLIEKPLATTEAAGEDMVRRAGKAGVPLMVAQTLRFNRSLEAFRCRLSELGLIHSLNITLTVPTRPRPPENPGFGGRGALLDLGIHTLDLARYLTGTCPRVEACWLDHLPPAGLDTRADIRLSTAQGLTLEVLVAWSQFSRVGTAEAAGPGGRLSVDWVNDHLIDRRNGKLPIEWTEANQPTIVAVLAGFLEAILHNRPVPVPGQEGLEALKLVEACYRMAICRETVGPEQA